MEPLSKLIESLIKEMDEDKSHTRSISVEVGDNYLISMALNRYDSKEVRDDVQEREARVCSRYSIKRIDASLD